MYIGNRQQEGLSQPMLNTCMGYERPSWPVAKQCSTTELTLLSELKALS